MTEQSEATERDQLRLNEELEKISAWGDQLTDLVAALEELADYFQKYAALPPYGRVSAPGRNLRRLSDHFHEVRLNATRTHVLEHLCHSQTWGFDRIWCLWHYVLPSRFWHCTLFAGS